jgi:hypothetical protein
MMGGIRPFDFSKLPEYRDFPVLFDDCKRHHFFVDPVWHWQVAAIGRGMLRRRMIHIAPFTRTA